MKDRRGSRACCSRYEASAHIPLIYSIHICAMAKKELSHFFLLFTCRPAHSIGQTCLNSDNKAVSKPSMECKDIRAV